jgi:hypothetical protein
MFCNLNPYRKKIGCHGVEILAVVVHAWVNRHFVFSLVIQSLANFFVLSTPTNGGSRIFFGQHFTMLTAIVADTIFDMAIVKIRTAAI